MNKQHLILLGVIPCLIACPEPDVDDAEQGDSDPSSETSTGDGDGDGDGDGAGDGDGDGDSECPELTPADGDSSASIRSCEPHDLVPQLDPTQAETLAADNLQLALDLYHALRENEAKDRGFAISPYSLQSAFGMLYGGTVDPARGEIESTLHFSLLDDQHEAFNWLDEQLVSRNLEETGDADPVIVHPVNASWIRGDLADRLQPNYLDLLSIHYDTGMFLAGFETQPDVERGKINDWVAERTHDLIPELFPEGTIDETTNFVLVNALYVKAPWFTPFEAETTEPGPFTLLDGTTIDVDMMNNTEMLGTQNSGAGWWSLTLPLRNEDLVFVAIVPDDFAAFEASLDVDTLGSILDFDEDTVWNTLPVVLPRFSLESEFGLKDELTELGMTTAFQDSSSFSGIVDGQPITIGQVIQKTTIMVEEGGIEAAAASGIDGMEPGGPDPIPPILVDRPFLLAIYDRPTHTPLFFGRVLNPTEM